ncbi:sensor histidine kinase [Cohnella cholangitidis]|uniref:histidine kinase n=1 Tax=Cohnella cholangitidis TaxID=2598458 RepID=A0A7G5C5L5_9BACL|nr:sensor histidine kinase [Cohnella cholangitidis]QMV44499.1 hypothetical protein FPL14_27505 [Cohnella cholangitidis]
MSRNMEWTSRLWGKRIAGLLILFAAWAAVSGCTSESQSNKPIPKAEQGVMDLKAWSWNKDGIIPLNGQWRFEWFNASDAGGKAPGAVKSTLEVPGTWGDLKMEDGTALQDQGYGVYRLTIIHRIQNEMLAIRIPNIATAYVLSIDGTIVMSRGQAAANEEEAIPFQLPATVHFAAAGTETELTLAVANYDHRDGGIRTEIVLGNSERIQKLQVRHAAQELIVLGCLIMIGFYHLGLFILRRKEVANMMFAMLCFFVGLRMGLIGEGFLVQWIGVMDWELAIRLEYIAFVLAGWSGFAFFQTLYPHEIKHAWFKLSSWIAAVLTLSVLFVKPLLFTSWIWAFQVYILFFSIIVLAGLVLSALRRREGARLALIGVAGLVLTIVNDMLFYNGWWRSVDLLPFGLLFLILMNSFIISLRFSLTYDRAERMSLELTEWNNSLEQRIADRTDELQFSYQTLEQAKVDLERLEQSRLQLVSNISHDLRTPITLLQGYLEALRDKVISEPAQRDNTIRLMLTKVEGLNSLIQDLFDLSVLEARKVELSLERVPLLSWKDRITEQYGLEMLSRGISFDCSLMTEAAFGAAVTIDTRRMDRVFANLLYNALKFTPSGGTIRIEMRTDPDQPMAEVLVIDSGVGIDPDDLPHIFDRYFKKEKSRNPSSAGSGLGLAISKEIVEMHGGNISAYNAPEGGSVFRIGLPLTD